MPHTFIYPLANAILGACLRLFSRYSVEGLTNVPPSGPLLVVANHLSNVDPPLLGITIPRPLHFLAKRGLFHDPLLRFVLRGYGAFPIDRDGRDIQGFKWALRLLQQGEALAIFPEGTRNPGGMGQPVSGVALLHLRSGAPILPVGITGTGHLGHTLRIFFPTGTITVRIGQPFTLPPVRGKIPQGQLEEVTDQIMRRVAELLPQSYRGVYAQQTGPARRTLPPPKDSADEEAASL